MQLSLLTTLLVVFSTLRIAAMPSVAIPAADSGNADSELAMNATHIHHSRTTIKGTVEAAAEAGYKWATSGDLTVSVDSDDVYAIVNDGDSAFGSMSRYADRAERMLQNDGDWAVLVIEEGAIVEEPGPDTHRRKIKLNFQAAPFWNRPDDVVLAWAYFCHEDGSAKVKKFKPDGSQYIWVLRGDARPVGDVFQLDTPAEDRVFTLQFHAWGNVDSVYSSGSG